MWAIKSHRQPGGQTPRLSARGRRSPAPVGCCETLRRVSNTVRDGSRTALRSPWVVAWVAVTLLWLLVGLAMVTPSEEETGNAAVDIPGAIMGWAITLPAIWVLVRIPFIRVTLNAEGLTSHGVFRRKTAPWAEIQDCEMDVVGGNEVASYYAPVVALRDGESWPLMQLAGYTRPRRATRSRIARQSRQIRERARTDGA
jgi:hypothetical protein